MMLPGVSISTKPDDYAAFKTLRIAIFDGLGLIGRSLIRRITDVNSPGGLLHWAGVPPSAFSTSWRRKALLKGGEYRSRHLF